MKLVDLAIVLVTGAFLVLAAVIRLPLVILIFMLKRN
jgi:hypothetical protein